MLTANSDILTPSEINFPVFLESMKGVNRGIETERFPLSPPDEVAAWSGEIAGKYLIYPLD